MISQTAIDLIVDFEVTSKAAYISRYQQPTWPGGASGVTIGIGYDLGYSTQTQIKNDWGKLPNVVVNQLLGASGVTGSEAVPYCHSMRAIRVPWDLAMEVFEHRDMPKWEGMVAHALQHTDHLSPDSRGALVSLAYNRGCSFSNAGDRYREMRAIRDNMASQNFDAIPDCFRAMKRLWPNVRGLQIRRDKEADLFQKGLDSEYNQQAMVSDNH